MLIDVEAQRADHIARQGVPSKHCIALFRAQIALAMKENSGTSLGESCDVAAGRRILVRALIDVKVREFFVSVLTCILYVVRV